MTLLSNHLPEGLVVGLVLAAVTGISVVGYKHPAGFRRMVKAAVPAFFIAVSFRVAWVASGINAASNSLSRRLLETPETPLLNIEYSIQSLGESVSDGIETFWFTLAVIVYTTFFWFLPGVLAAPSEAKLGDAGVLHQGYGVRIKLVPT